MVLSSIGTGATIAITIKAIDNFSGTFKKAVTGTSKLKNAFKLGTTAAVGLGVALVGIGVSAVKSAIQLEPIERSFKSLAINSDNFLVSLEKATAGTVSSFELMANANKALLLGLDQEALPSLFKNAAIVGRAAGRTTTEAIQDITLGIGRQSKLILDNLGIIVKAEEAYDSYALSIGKTSKELTDNEKKVAFSTAAIASLEEKAASLGGTIEGDTVTSFEKMTAAMANAKDEIGKALLPVVIKLFDKIIPLIPQIGEKLVGVFEKITEVLLEGDEPLIDTLVELTDSFLDLVPTIVDVFIPAIRVMAGVLKLITPILKPILKFLGFLIDVLNLVAENTVFKAINSTTSFLGGLFKKKNDGTTITQLSRTMGTGSINSRSIAPSVSPNSSSVIVNIDRVQGIDAESISQELSRVLSRSIRR